MAAVSAAITVAAAGSAATMVAAPAGSVATTVAAAGSVPVASEDLAVVLEVAHSVDTTAVVSAVTMAEAASVVDSEEELVAATTEAVVDVDIMVEVPGTKM